MGMYGGDPLTTAHSLSCMMTLLQWHKVYKGSDWIRLVFAYPFPLNNGITEPLLLPQISFQMARFKYLHTHSWWWAQSRPHSLVKMSFTDPPGGLREWRAFLHCPITINCTYIHHNIHVHITLGWVHVPGFPSKSCHGTSFCLLKCYTFHTLISLPIKKKTRFISFGSILLDADFPPMTQVYMISYHRLI